MSTELTPPFHSQPSLSPEKIIDVGLPPIEPDTVEYWKHKANTEQKARRELEKVVKTPADSVQAAIASYRQSQEFEQILNEKMEEKTALLAQQYQSQVQEAVAAKQALELKTETLALFNSFSVEFAAAGGDTSAPQVSQAVFDDLNNSGYLMRSPAGQILIVDPATKQPTLDEAGQPILLQAALEKLSQDNYYGRFFKPKNQSVGSRLQSGRQTQGSAPSRLIYEDGGGISGVSVDDLAKGNFTR